MMAEVPEPALPQLIKKILIINFHLEEKASKEFTNDGQQHESYFFILN